MKIKTVAVDFDGTLAKELPYSEFPACGEPIKEGIATIREFRKRGGKVILWTLRGGESLEPALALCARYGLSFDAINENLPELVEAWTSDHPEGCPSPKVAADLYIDDRSVGGLDWGKVREVLLG